MIWMPDFPGIFGVGKSLMRVRAKFGAERKLKQQKVDQTALAGVENKRARIDMLTYIEKSSEKTRQGRKATTVDVTTMGMESTKPNSRYNIMTPNLISGNRRFREEQLSTRQRLFRGVVYLHSQDAQGLTSHRCICTRPRIFILAYLKHKSANSDFSPSYSPPPHAQPHHPDPHPIHTIHLSVSLHCPILVPQTRLTQAYSLFH